MRKLMWFAIGFCVSCAVFTRTPGNSADLIAVLLLLLLGVWLFIRDRKRVSSRIAAFIIAGISAGVIWVLAFTGFYLQPLQMHDGETLQLTITATGYSEPTRYSQAVDAVAVIEGKPYKIRTYLNGFENVEPGDILTGSFRIRITTPGSNSESSYDRGNGTYIVASKKGDVTLQRPERKPIWCAPAVMAQNVKMVLEKCFPEDTAAMAKALLLGDTSDLTYAEDTALKISGIRHIVAVSGLHVSIIFWILLSILDSHRVLLPLVTIPVLAVFSAMTGFTPSVTRACLMTGLMVIGYSALEEYDAMTSLSFAALLMLVFNPFVVESVSFQLSVSSVAGILMFADKVNRKLYNMIPDAVKTALPGKLTRWITGSLSVSISATVATTPLSAYYFGVISLVGLLTNLLTLWVVGFAFFGTAIVGVFGSLFESSGLFFASGVSWFYRYIMVAAHYVSGFRFSAVYTQSFFIVTWLVFCYVLLACYFMMKQKHGRVFFGLGVAFLIVAVCTSVVVPRLDDVRLHVLDVGEGQAILLQSEGHTFLIDCGGDSDTGTANEIAQTLLSQGIKRIDGIVLTHYDRDHSGALVNLCTRIETDSLYLPVMDDGGYLSENECLKEQKIIYVSEYRQLPLGEGVLTLTKPGNLKTTNENCLCVLFESEKCDILITGDRSRSGEKRLIKEMDIPDVDILIAGHHGSKNATSEELLAAAKPETVVISVGKNNTYGHPAQEVLERLAEYECVVYRTDLDGSVLIRR